MKDYSKEILEMGTRAKTAARLLRTKSSAEKDAFLIELYNQLDIYKDVILKANEQDVSKAREGGTKESLVERLLLSEKRFSEMKEGLLQVASLKDPVGEIDSMWVNSSGLKIGSRRVPIGVIAMIYESRPNVTIDAAALCIKTGNAVILKGGSDALNTNIALMKAVDKTIQIIGFPEGTAQLVETADRDFTGQLLSARDLIDCVIPRGSAGLISFVANNSKIPIIETGTGNCHIYVDKGYDIKNAVEIIMNAKTQRPGACNAVETVLVHSDCASKLLKSLVPSMQASGVTLALCESSFRISHELGLELEHCREATGTDWETEFLDLILAVKVVNTLEDAIEHIYMYSTGHSEAILTKNYDNAQKFLDFVDSAAVYVNASTRFTDGGEFGFGAEIGISTQKLHARGPMGLKALTTNKYIVYGSGQIRN